MKLIDKCDKIEKRAERSGAAMQEIEELLHERWPQIRAALLAAEKATKYHCRHCDAICGPPTETWIVHEKCDCNTKELKRALDALDVES